VPALSPVEPDRWSALTDPSFAAAARWPEPESPPSRHSAGEAPPQTAAVPVTPPPVVRPVPDRRQAPPVPPAAQPQTRMTLRPEVPPPAEFRPEIPPYRRRHEGGPTADQPGGGYRMVAPSEPAPVSGPTTRGTRVAEILAENGGPPPSGGRRRRRYREDGEPDDVLARVLGRD
jgi:hypothetical protein